MTKDITPEEIAAMIDHSLLHPTLTDSQMIEGCRLARRYQVASVCIKPYAVKLAAEELANSPVKVGTVIGFPHGNSTVEVKVAETIKACNDGASEIDMVVNIGKVLQGDWAYVSAEIGAVHAVCKSSGAILKVIFENDFLPEDSYKVELCRICSDVGVEYVKTSTGYGFVKGEDGKYDYQGATFHDLELMREHSDAKVQIKAAGGVRTLEDVLAVRALGVSRIGASATEAILLEAERRFKGII